MSQIRRRVPGSDPAKSIDALMESASEHLLAMRYFECERACLKAMTMARRQRDFERMARICMPLQEARRQRRQMAMDAGVVAVVDALKRVPRPLVPGVLIVQPPLIGAEAKSILESALARDVPVEVLTREPMTEARQWPIVAVGEQVVRTKVAPPAVARWTGTGVTRDELTGLPDRAWVEMAMEALGDAAIAKVRPDDPPEWQVDDLLEFLEALPTHEKLHQALERACRAAIGSAPPKLPRRRGLVDDPFSF